MKRKYVYNLVVLDKNTNFRVVYKQVLLNEEDLNNTIEEMFTISEDTLDSLNKLHGVSLFRNTEDEFLELHIGLVDLADEISVMAEGAVVVPMARNTEECRKDPLKPTTQYVSVIKNKDLMDAFYIYRDNETRKHETSAFRITKEDNTENISEYPTSKLRNELVACKVMINEKNIKRFTWEEVDMIKMAIVRRVIAIIHKETGLMIYDSGNKSGYIEHLKKTSPELHRMRIMNSNVYSTFSMKQINCYDETKPFVYFNSRNNRYHSLSVDDLLEFDTFSFLYKGNDYVFETNVNSVELTVMGLTTRECATIFLDEVNPNEIDECINEQFKKFAPDDEEFIPVSLTFRTYNELLNKFVNVEVATDFKISPSNMFDTLCVETSGFKDDDVYKTIVAFLSKYSFTDFMDFAKQYRFNPNVSLLDCSDTEELGRIMYVQERGEITDDLIDNYFNFRAYGDSLTVDNRFIETDYGILNINKGGR